MPQSYTEINSWKRPSVSLVKTEGLLNATGDDPKTPAEFDALISAKKQRIHEFRQAELDWRSASNVSCSGKIGKKKDECVADKAWKKAQADSYLAQVNALQGEVNQLELSKKALIDRMASENTATVTLSQQGISNQALQTQAQFQGQATLEAAKIKAQAEAEAMVRSAAATKSTGNGSWKIAIIIVASMATILVIALIIRKMRKNKSK